VGRSLLRGSRDLIIKGRLRGDVRNLWASPASRRG